jgi:hypothetical protein
MQVVVECFDDDPERIVPVPEKIFIPFSDNSQAKAAALPHVLPTRRKSTNFRNVELSF